MRKTNNTTHIEGLLYKHELKRKVSGPNSAHPGTEFITGTIDIATDNSILNIVSVHFTYVTALTAKGTPNATFDILSRIESGALNTYMAGGIDKAAKLRIDSAIDVNDFYNKEGTLVSAKRNEGGFVHLVNDALRPDEHQRSTFRCDMLITKFFRKEADTEKNLPEKGIISGYTFNFRGSLIPVDIVAYDSTIMNWFESQGITEKTPIFYEVSGEQISTTTIIRREIPGMFKTQITETPSTQREFVITDMKPEPYEWDSESGILATEFIEKKAERDIYLATVKQRQDEYNASRNAAPSIAQSAPVVNGGFNF